MKLTPKEKKELIVYFIIIFLFLTLLHGNELGQFRNTDKADAKLDLAIYIVCLIPLLLFIRKGFSKLATLKLKIFTIIVVMVVALLPTFLLTGLGKYIDYYTSDKHWKIENVTITNKGSSGGGRGGTIYLYTVKIKDSTIQLSSKLNCPIEEVLHLKICTTNLGMIIADKYYK